MSFESNTQQNSTDGTVGLSDGSRYDFTSRLSSALWSNDEMQSTRGKYQDNCHDYHSNNNSEINQILDGCRIVEHNDSNQEANSDNGDEQSTNNSDKISSSEINDQIISPEAQKNERLSAREVAGLIMQNGSLEGSLESRENRDRIMRTINDAYNIGGEELVSHMVEKINLELKRQGSDYRVTLDIDSPSKDSNGNESRLFHLGIYKGDRIQDGITRKNFTSLQYSEDPSEWARHGADRTAWQQ